MAIRFRRSSSRRSSLKDTRGESQQFRRRALVGFLLILAGLSALACRYMFLQVTHHDEYSTRSDQNRIKPRVIPPTRGLIYDRNGVLLADNVAAFRLEVTPDQVDDMDTMLTQLGAVVPLDPDEVQTFHKQLKLNRRFDSVPLKTHLSEDDIARFAVNSWRFPGVQVVPYLTRRYPQGELFAHVVGYVSRIDDKDLDRLDPDLYKNTTHVGRTGVERSYEDLLHGTPGVEAVEVNADGQTQRVLSSKPPIAGKNLYLSIDVRLQKAATEAFGGRLGAAVAIDPRNGQVLALVSVPSFDSNLFVNGISNADYKALTQAEDKPLLNRALQSAYQPGSTVKPFLALGGLELGVRRPQDTVLSTGQFCLPGHSRCYRDDERGGNGVVNMVRAIELSTNTYFYKLALDMGIDRLDAWMSQFSFGAKTGIDLPTESPGVLPSRAWKKKHDKFDWFPGDTVISGIGQGFWNVTPIQLAHAVATLAAHGVPYTPRVVMDTRGVLDTQREALPNPPIGPSLIQKPADWAVVNQGMEAVIKGGTGKAAFIGFPYVVAGKSGTAERFSRVGDAYDTNKNTAYLAKRHRALFIAYMPTQDPRIAVAVVLEAGAWGGSDAGPIARKIFEAWLSEQGDNAPPGRLPETVAAPAAKPTDSAAATDSDAASMQDEDEPAEEGSADLPAAAGSTP